MDLADRAQELELVHQEHALRRQLQQTRIVSSSRSCMGCAEEIPEQRRAALPGCGLCVECQDDFERGMGR